MVEGLGLSDDTWGPYHLSLPVHSQIQKVLRQRNEQKAALTLTEAGSRGDCSIRAFTEEWVLAVCPASHVEVISLTPKARL